MAKVWIKWRAGFGRSAGVFNVARLMGLDMRIVATCLMEFYEHFEQNARDIELGTRSMTLEQIDEMIRLPRGFTEAVIKAKLVKKMKHRLVAIDRSWVGSVKRDQKGMSFVYFIRSEQSGFIKIGFSHDPQRRISELATSQPVKLLGYFTGTKHTEANLHVRFAECRAHGEWFKPEAVLVAYLRDRGFIT